MPATMEKWFLGFLLWKWNEVCYRDHEVELLVANAFDAEVMARKYWINFLGEATRVHAKEIGPQLVKAHSPHLIFRKNLFPGTAMFDWDSNSCPGTFIFFTIWDDNLKTEVLIRETLDSKLTDQAWVEAHWLWKEAICKCHEFAAIKTISVKPPNQVVYPHTPYLAVRKPLRF
jgi:hypothetical protein